MLGPNAEGRTGLPRLRTAIPQPAAPRADGQRHSLLPLGQALLKQFPNSHLHLAILVALATASLIAFAVPIASSQASTQPASSPPLTAAGDGLIAALRTQAQTVAGIIAPSAGDATPTQAYSRLGVVGGARLVPPSLLAAAGQLAAGGAFSKGRGYASMVIQRQNAVSFTIHQQGLSSSHASSQVTVGQALAEAGIRLTDADSVSPAPESRLTPGMHIYVAYSNSVRLIVEGQERLTYTHGATVGDALREAGVQLEATDRVFPPVDQAVRPGMTLSVVTVRETHEFSEEPIEYGTVYQQDAGVALSQKIPVRAGADGLVRREYRIVRINGQEVKREFLAQTIVPAIDALVAVGTRAAAVVQPALAPAPAAAAGDVLNCVRSLTVYATWYTAASAGGTTTKTGTAVYKGIVAVDPSVIPLGTRMYIPGYGYGLAADTGGGIKGNMIDLAYAADDIKDWRTRYVDICILG